MLVTEPIYGTYEKYSFVTDDRYDSYILELLIHIYTYNINIVFFLPTHVGDI